MAKVIWFTGLSGSGKTTIAIELQRMLEMNNKKVVIIDGDVIRNTLHTHLGFSREDIKTNNILIAELAVEKMKGYDFVLIPIISPYKEDREAAKKIITKKNFIELYINTPLDVCIKRDVKGLYRKAIDGEIENFIGISEANPYQPPENPDIEVNGGNASIEENATAIFNLIMNYN